MTELGDLAAALDAVLPRYQDLLLEMSRIPSERARPEALDASASLLCDVLDRLGARDVDVVRDADGAAPTVIARVGDATARVVVMLYAHHDVQPASNDGSWSSDPFVPEERSGRLYGRGTADDKAAVAMYLALVEVLSAVDGLQIQLVIDGGEESGSPSMPQALEAMASWSAPRLTVVADGTNTSADTAAITASLRGFLEIEVSMRTLQRGVHSGVYGGVVPDALTELIRVLATMHDDRGLVAIDGIPNDAPLPSSFGSLPDSQALTAVALPGVAVSATPELSNWWSTTITISAVDGPRVGEGAPVLAETARARISVRLAPLLDEGAAFARIEAHLRAHAGDRGHIEVRRVAGASGLHCAPDGDMLAAYRRGADQAGLLATHVVGSGASLPVARVLHDSFPLSSLMLTGVADQSSEIHGADESLDLHLWRAVAHAHLALLLAATRLEER